MGDFKAWHLKLGDQWNKLKPELHEQLGRGLSRGAVRDNITAVWRRKNVRRNRNGRGAVHYFLRVNLSI